MSSTVAFLGHILQPFDLRHLDPAFEALGPEGCRRFLARVQPVLAPFVHERVTVRSRTGDEVSAYVLVAPFTSEDAMRDREGRPSHARKLVREGVVLARELGAETVGLGAYTSIVSDNGRAIGESGIGITTGNSLTVVAAVDALLATVDRMALHGRRLAVLGAAGNIGSMVAQLASSSVDELLLIGTPRTVHRLEAASGRFKCRTRVSADLSELRTCNMIVAATNSPTPVVHAEHLAKGPVVLCDIATPSDVSASIAIVRPDCVVFQGGVVRLPLGQDVAVDGVRFSPGRIFACLAETLILGLEGLRGHYSYGPLELSKIHEMRRLAARHGFTFEQKGFTVPPPGQSLETPQAEGGAMAHPAGQ